MKLSRTGLATVAAAALFVVPASAQNTAAVVDNAVGATGNAAEAVGNSISTGAGNLVDTADNAVDVDITSDPSVANTTMPMDNMAMNDANMMATDPMMDENMTTTTTTTQRQERGGNGRWGLLGLLGLAGFLFRPKKGAIHLDERDGRR